MMNLNDHLQEANHRYQTILAERSNDRLAHQAREPRKSIVRRVARLAGNALVQLGIRLLRVGQDELAHTIELLHPPVRQSRLN